VPGRVRRYGMIKKGQKEAVRKRRLDTPETKQTRVIAAYLAGRSRLAIARDEHMNRGTVYRILSQSQVADIIEEYRGQVRDLIPACIGHLQRKLLTKNGQLKKNGVDWRMLVDLLKGTQILVNREVQEQERVADRFNGWTEEQLERYINTGERPTITVQGTSQGSLPERTGGEGSGKGRAGEAKD
jgi:hypothetical protein